MHRLDGKVAIVTGAGSGIGKGIALMFGKEGAAVIVNDINRETAIATTEELCSFKAETITLPCNVASTKEAEQMVNEALAAFGRIDILVNNAGINDHRPFTEITEEAWDMMLTINLKSTFNCTKAVIGHMIDRRGGAIVNISSGAGIGGTPYHVHYSASKGGIIAFTKALAQEMAKYGIRINAVAPGIVDTPGSKRVEEFYRKVLPGFTVTNPPLGVIGQPEDIAYACVYIASNEARYVTGQVLSPNGGARI